MPYFELANIVMLFLLTVVLVALKFGRGPAILAAFVSVAAFDFFCVPPRMSFAVSDAQYLLTFAVMLAVALIIGQMTAGLRYQARIASYREERARSLYEFARDLSSLLETQLVVDTTARFIAQTFRADVAVLVPDDQERVAVRNDGGAALAVDVGAAQWAYDKAQPAGLGTDTLAGNAFLYLPLRAPMRTRGVLAIKPENRRVLLVPEQQRQLDTFAALAAIALERVHYVEVAQQVLIQMESERLRNSLLAALSHDLRTPLAALVGLAESLAMTTPAPTGTQLETAQAIADEARRMSALVNNLLDMARIQSGEVKLRRQWLPFEEVVGSALKSAQSALVRHPVEVELGRDLPLVELDATLIERVLYNILENAGKYTPEGTIVRLTAEVAGTDLLVAISDAGPACRKARKRRSSRSSSAGRANRQPPASGSGSRSVARSSKRIVERSGPRTLRREAPASVSRCRWARPPPRRARRARASDAAACVAGQREHSDAQRRMHP